MIKILRPIFIIFSVMVIFSISGCSSIDKLKVKMGLKNNDFEYINQGKIKKVTIQDTRDKGYRFTVTDPRTIKDLYTILSTAKPVKEKSALAPDYIFEMEETPDKIYKFNYIAGIDSKNAGNLYSGDKIYQVSSRLDNDILVSFWNTRTPKNFKYIYYESILEAIGEYSKTADKSKKTGINISDDTESAKFVLSKDLEEFKANLKRKYSNFELIEDQNAQYDMVMNISTEGYKSTLYKMKATFSDKTQNSEKKYYILSVYNNQWKITIKADSKPEGY